MSLLLPPCKGGVWSKVLSSRPCGLELPWTECFWCLSSVFKRPHHVRGVVVGFLRRMLRDSPRSCSGMIRFCRIAVLREVEEMIRFDGSLNLFHFYVDTFSITSILMLYKKRNPINKPKY